MKNKKIKCGEFLFKQGDISTEMFYIEKGKVAVLCKDSQDRNVPVTTVESGNFIGEFAFFDQLERTASVMALEDVELKVINQEHIDQFGANARFVIKKLINKMKNMNEQIAQENSKKNSETNLKKVA